MSSILVSKNCLSVEGLTGYRINDLIGQIKELLLSVPTVVTIVSDNNPSDGTERKLIYYFNSTPQHHMQLRGYSNTSLAWLYYDILKLDGVTTLSMETNVTNVNVDTIYFFSILSIDSLTTLMCNYRVFHIATSIFAPTYNLVFGNGSYNTGYDHVLVTEDSDVEIDGDDVQVSLDASYPTYTSDGKYVLNGIYPCHHIPSNRSAAIPNVFSRGSSLPPDGLYTDGTSEYFAFRLNLGRTDTYVITKL